LAASPSFAKHQTPSVSQDSESPANSLYFFVPPDGWEIADPNTLTPRVKIAFLKRSNKGFCPSINLAVEETTVSLSEYLKAVKAIHEQDRTNHWRALGKVRTQAGLAQLTEIDSNTDLGPVRILQLILIKEGRAYVLTAAALKEEISEYYKDFQAAFRSLTLTSDLLSNIPQLERRENLKEKQQQLLIAAQESLKSFSEKKNLLDDNNFQEKHWAPFQSFILENFKDMGTFWQIMLLKNNQEKLLSLDLSEVDTTQLHDESLNLVESGQNSPPEIQ
jgi:hypothetical protein